MAENETKTKERRIEGETSFSPSTSQAALNESLRLLKIGTITPRIDAQYAENTSSTRVVEIPNPDISDIRDEFGRYPLSNQGQDISVQTRIARDIVTGRLQRRVDKNNKVEVENSPLK